MKKLIKILFLMVITSLSIALSMERKRNRGEDNSNNYPPTKKQRGNSQNGPNQRLLNAIETGDPDTAEIAIGEGADVDLTDRFGTPVLVRVLKHKWYRILTLLIRSGANISAEGETGMNALQYAFNMRDTRAYALLLDAGASIPLEHGVQDEENWLEEVILPEHFENKEEYAIASVTYSLFKAIRTDDHELASTIFSEHSYCVGVSSFLVGYKGESIIECAVRQNALKVAFTLLKLGAQLTSKSDLEKIFFAALSSDLPELDKLALLRSLFKQGATCPMEVVIPFMCTFQDVHSLMHLLIEYRVFRPEVQEDVINKSLAIHAVTPTAQVIEWLLVRGTTNNIDYVGEESGRELYNEVEQLPSLLSALLWHLDDTASDIIGTLLQKSLTPLQVTTARSAFILLAAQGKTALLLNLLFLFNDIFDESTRREALLTAVLQRQLSTVQALINASLLVGSELQSALECAFLWAAVLKDGPLFEYLLNLDREKKLFFNLATVRSRLELLMEREDVPEEDQACYAQFIDQLCAYESEQNKYAAPWNSLALFLIWYFAVRIHSDL